MSGVMRNVALLALVVSVTGCCTWKKMTGSQDMIQEPPTVDIQTYRTLAVMSVRPMPGDPALSEVSTRLVRFGGPHGLTILKGDQLSRLNQMAQERLNALQARTNFQQQMAQQQRAEQDRMLADATNEQMALDQSDVERNASYTAAVAASEGIAGEYKNEIKRIFSEAMANSQAFGIPQIDGLIFVDLKEFGRPSYFAMAGGYGGYSGNIKTVTLHARVAWELVNPNTGQIITGDVYKCEETAVAELGATVKGAHGQFAFDLGGLQDKLWAQIGYKVSENFYPHERPECEEKGGIQR